MRLLTLMAITTLAIALPLGLLSPDLWIKAFINAKRFVTEDLGFKISLLGDAVNAVLETLFISIFGVSAGTMIAYLLAPLASPVIAGRHVAIPFRLVANAIRSIPAIFWAILFVILVGPGPKAGALALAVYTAAYLIKFFYENLESISPDQVDSLRVIGLRGITLAMALYMHIRRQIISNILFMLEYNVRTATIVGFVGAGGVGYYILQYMNMLDYPAVLTFVIVTMVFVIAIDTFSYIVRVRV